MLEFKEIDYKKDLSQVVQLLNSSLESTHTKEAFLWKHFENPFGKSYGLIALDGSKIVGIRMFMKWQFEGESGIIKAVRPVDTCTDPEYRGRGIFRDLTHACLENLEGEYDIVFNTPNANSRPGNLKMGWVPIRNEGFRYKIGVPIPHIKSENYEGIKLSQLNLNNNWQNDFKVRTKISSAFLRWRYKNSEYKFAKFNTSGIVVFKVQNLKGIKTIILVDFFGNSGDLPKYLYSICKRNRAPVVYYLNNLKPNKAYFLYKIDRGVQMVVSKEDRYNIKKEIHFSLGDLEARL